MTSKKKSTTAGSGAQKHDLIGAWAGPIGAKAINASSDDASGSKRFSANKGQTTGCGNEIDPLLYP